MTPVVELQQVACGMLRALDLRAYPGERVGVIAEAGSGKSVLAELLVGARQPRRGRVRRDGVDVTRRAGKAPGAAAAGSGTDAAPGVGWVAQPARPFRRLSVYENVLVAAAGVRGRTHRVADGHARRALTDLGLEHRADQLPGDLAEADAVRLDVARVVAAPRRLIVVDQLADRVDESTRRQVVEILEVAVAAGAALVWLERQDEAPTAVDRLLVLAYGRIAQEGPPDQVLATPYFRRATRAQPDGGTGAGPPAGGQGDADPSAGSDRRGATGAGTSPDDGADTDPEGAPIAGTRPAGGDAEATPPGGGSVDPSGASPDRPDGPDRADAAPGRAGGEPGRGPSRRRRGRRGAASPPALVTRVWSVNGSAIPGRAAEADGRDPGFGDVDLEVAVGEIVTLVSAGSAATTVLRSLAGLVEAQGGLWVGGRELTGLSAAARARAGLAFVPEDGGVADSLTVAQHLSLAGARRLRRRWTSRAVYDLFPSLSAARHRTAGTLPALERRCLALARALVADPRLVLVDQPGRGLPARSVPLVAEALTVVARTAGVVVAEKAETAGRVTADRIVELDRRAPLPGTAPAGATR